jgi:polyisoprenyl-phosphate glycosyltransferase
MDPDRPSVDVRAAGAPTLSVVAPMYCEAANVRHFLEGVSPVLEALDPAYEIVCVNDGSSDDTLALLVEAASRDSHLKVVDLSRNFGKDIALTAGLDHARGEAVICMDADLQHPPELIRSFVEQWREGYDVVYAAMRSREGEGVIKRTLTRAFYWLFNHLSKVPAPAHAGDYRLLDRRVVEVLKRMPERTRFMKGLFSWVGFRQHGVPYDPAPRHGGTSAWGFLRLWNFAVDGLVAFSSMPLVVWSYVGFLVALLAMLYGSFLILRTLVLGADVPGYPSLMVTVLFLGGVQLLSLGIIGEYLSRIYREVKGRPMYVVNRTYGFAEPAITHERPPEPALGEAG